MFPLTHDKKKYQRGKKLQWPGTKKAQKEDNREEEEKNSSNRFFVLNCEYFHILSLVLLHTQGS
jgi:hypothetical protein